MDLSDKDSSKDMSVPRLASSLSWHLLLFVLPGNLALGFKQMHPEGLMPGIVRYDLCSIFSHNPENFQPKRHTFSLFSICYMSYLSQSYFSVNLNFSRTLSGVNNVSTSCLLHNKRVHRLLSSMLRSTGHCSKAKKMKITFGGHCWS